jgi:hypothetical protein
LGANATDYRFCWIRDSNFATEVLELTMMRRWIVRHPRRRPPGPAEPAHYRLDGGIDLLTDALNGPQNPAGLHRHQGRRPGAARHLRHLFETAAHAIRALTPTRAPSRGRRLRLREGAIRLGIWEVTTALSFTIQR